MKPNAKDLDRLIARVEQATGGDRELDLELGKVLLGWYLYEHNAYQDYDTDWAEWRWPDGKQVFVFGAVTAFTASIDAALGLMERVLPEWRPSTQRSRAGLHDCYLHCDDKTGWLRQSHGQARTLPLAIILATLKALQSKPEGDVR